MYFPGAFVTDGSAYPAPHPVPCYSGHALVGYAWYGPPPPQYGGMPYGVAGQPYGMLPLGGAPHVVGHMAPMHASAGTWVVAAPPTWEPYWATHGHTAVRAGVC